MRLAAVGDDLNYNIDRATGEIIEVHNDMTYEQRERDLQAAEKAEERKRKADKDSPFNNFLQVNNSSPEYGIARRALIRKSPVAAQIWDFLTEKANKYNAVVCSLTVLEESLGYGIATIARGVKVLKDMKFVDIKKSGTTNVYLLNKQLVWKSWGKNYKYAEFDAKVIISESEQEKPTKTQKMDVVEIK